MFFLRLLFAMAVCLLGCNQRLFCGERGSSAPFITGDTFRAYADHVFDETTDQFFPEKVKKGDLIFVKSDWEYLDAFFSRYHPQIPYPYLLLTHNSDYSAPGPFKDYLDDEKLIAWFAQNVEGSSHAKLWPIPIGIANKRWEHGNLDIFSSALPLASNSDRPLLCYVNFQISTYPNERSYVWNLFSIQPWCTAVTFTSFSSCLRNFSQSKFVISPRGNGLDCHRTWEALLMGAIPILRSSSLDSLFSDLPVLIVKDWEMVSESYLNEQYELIKQRSYNRSKLFFEDWLKSIQAVQKSVRDR